MIIGAFRLTFVVPPEGGTAHGTAQKIKDRLWGKFKCALSELPWEGTGGVAGIAHVVLGGAIVDHDEARARDRMDQIIRHLNDWGAVELVNDETDVVRFEDIELERDFEKYEP